MEEAINNHIKHVDQLFNRACKLLGIKNLKWKPMTRRTAPVNTANDYSLGYTDLATGEITLDILTPRRRQPKSSNGILRVIAHEIAHIQQPPYRQKHRGRWISRMHYPEFYDQVNANVEEFKKDQAFKHYFKQS